MKIKTIDLWTEPHTNQYECFNGAFIDGFEKGEFPYDEFKVVKNCNCKILSNKNIPISNKHNAIIFFRKKKPVRLVVINKDTDVEKCIKNALFQIAGNFRLEEYVKNGKIKRTDEDLWEKPILNEFNGKEEIDVGSCDRMELLKAMLKGSYTEDDTNFGHFDDNIYIYDPKIEIKYSLKVNDLCFEIKHKGAFYNTLKTRLIPIQADGELKKDDLEIALF